jgi:hypothetical protein
VKSYHNIHFHCTVALLKNLTIVEALCAAPRSERFHRLRLTSSNGLASSNCKKSIKMARVRSSARVSREGEETEVTGTTPISEVMERSGLVVTEGTIDEGTPDAEAEQTIVEEENVDEDEDEEDYNILIPTKPSHLDFEKSTVSEDDMTMMMKLGYFGEAEGKLFRFAREETTPVSKKDEVVVFKSFFRAGL